VSALEWIPGVRRVPFLPDGGSFTSTVRKWLWHTVEGATMAGALATYAQTGSMPHLTWNPGTGEVVQHVPFSRAARALKNEPGGVETNRDGVVQVEVVGFAAHPFTDGPMLGLDVLQRTWRALGIPERFPAGRPLPYPQSYGNNGQRSTATWTMGGHFCHSQAPENVHGDPGAIDPARLFAPPVSAEKIPTPEEPTVKLNKPVVAVVPHWGADRMDGYWMVCGDGGVFHFGAAPDVGTLGGVHLNEEIVDAVASRSQMGLMLVAADGGVFALGDAATFGSIPGLPG
jgi:hypothetical protein